MKYITIDNIDKFVGKTVDGGKLHFYPLRILKHPILGFAYIDRNGTMIPFHEDSRISYTTIK
jgi:hypothetical protein